MPVRAYERNWDESDIERTAEYTEFIQNLKQHHLRRNTLQWFTPEPGLGHKRLSLLKLYKKVIELGGYDEISNITSKWKLLANEYKVHEMSNSGYLLKNIYYKNLASFEIENHWGKEAPPKELMEELTAKGGDTLLRAEEWRKNKNSFSNSSSHVREPNALPSEVKLTDITASSSEIATYNNYSAPQSNDSVNRKSTRSALNPAEFYKPISAQPLKFSKYPTASSTYASLHLAPPSSALHFATATLPPSGIVPQPLITPAIEISYSQQQDLPQSFSRYSGQNLLSRIQLSLKSCQLKECQWATRCLTQVVKTNPDLQIRLIPILVEAVFNVIIHCLTNLGESLETKVPFFEIDVNEKLDIAGSLSLILRSFCNIEDNCRFIASLGCFKQLTHEIMRLRKDERFLEIFYNYLDLSVAVSEFYHIESAKDDLYQGAISILSTSDDSVLLRSSNSILTRLSFNDDGNILLQELTSSHINQLVLLLDPNVEEGLQRSALELMYQLSTYKIGSQLIMERRDFSSVINMLKTLALKYSTKQTFCPHIDANNIPNLPEEYLYHLLDFEEPERSARWLHSLFMEHCDGETLQEIIWHTYKTQFGFFENFGKPLLPPSELVKLISNVFPFSKAIVKHEVDQDQFYIKGIVPRLQASPIHDQILYNVEWKSFDENPKVYSVRVRNDVENKENPMCFYSSSITSTTPQSELTYIETRQPKLDKNGQANAIPELAIRILSAFAKTKRKALPNEFDFLTIAALNPSLAGGVAEIIVDTI